MTAPVCLFVYARPSHTQRTIEALAQNHLANETDLIVFSDGPKREEDATQVAQVRAYLESVRNFRSVRIQCRENNLGLARSIISGVSETLDIHKNVIVLEDDMVTSPYFLNYMNEGLTRFENDDRVISIHGFSYPVSQALPGAFFLKGADCWGWATWQRGWALFNPDGQHLLDSLRARELLRAFDFDGAYPYSKMLDKQIKGQNDSWAIRWYASAFLAGKLTLYPGRSLVHNIGNDGSGTHCGNTTSHDIDSLAGPIDLTSITVEESAIALQAFTEFFKQSRNPLKRVTNRLMQLVGRNQ